MNKNLMMGILLVSSGNALAAPMVYRGNPLLHVVTDGRIEIALNEHAQAEFTLPDVTKVSGDLRLYGNRYRVVDGTLLATLGKLCAKKQVRKSSGLPSLECTVQCSRIEYTPFLDETAIPTITQAQSCRLSQ